MAKRETIELGRAVVEIEERPGYLLVVETGRLTSLADLRVYHGELERIVRQRKVTRALIDARGEVGDAPPDVREAMWDWLLDPARGFEVVAFVLHASVAVTRVNMTALSRGANLRAFESVSEAQRWLARGGRPSSLAPRRPSVSATARTMRPGELEPDGGAQASASRRRPAAAVESAPPRRSAPVPSDTTGRASRASRHYVPRASEEEPGEGSDGSSSVA